MADLYVDGVPSGLYLSRVVGDAVGAPSADRHRFWASQPITPLNWARGPEVQSRDVVQHEFSGLRLVNSIHFLVSRYPLDVTAEYWHPLTARWVPLRQRIGKPSLIDPAYDVAAQRATWEGDPVGFSVLDSWPRVVDRSRAFLRTGQNPYHHGSRHWVPVKWETAPVTTKAIRLILTRRPTDQNSPKDPQGAFAPYSVAVRDLQIGYRVNSLTDVPEAGLQEEFTSSMDLLGNRVSYQLKKYEPHLAISGTEGLHWRSEPQPVNYAVVNYFVDVREPSGEGQVIDRFYLDPLTVGPSLNLYYTNEDPDGDYESDTSLLSFPIAQTHGEPQRLVRHPVSNFPLALSFDAATPSYVQVDNAYLQWDPHKPWWIGMNLTIKAADGTHPWLAWSGNTLRQNGSDVEFVTASGLAFSVPLTPEVGPLDSDVKVVLAYTPADLSSEVISTPKVTLSIEHGQARQTVVQALDADQIGSRPEAVYIGRYSTGSTAGVPAFDLKGMVVKTEQAQPGNIEGFLSEPDIFIVKDETHGVHDFTMNALLRQHPSFAHPDFPGGLMGGPGNRYEDVEWTPVSRDYVLRQGFMHFPAVKAKHFKFEFTNLVYEAYDSLVPVSRHVKLFPVDLVERHQLLAGGVETAWTWRNRMTVTTPAASHFNYAAQAPGVQTMMDVSDIGYATAVDRLRKIARQADDSPSGTEAYVATDPKAHSLLSDKGWVWSYMPWHQGTHAPKWHLKQKHVYETVKVQHKTKTGFFVGLRKVEAYRVDYLTDDDTDIYYEHFIDTRHIGNFINMEFDGEKITALSTHAQVTSRTFPSTREVRAVQFASIQTQNLPILADDGFVDPDLSVHWRAYGDATLVRRPNEGVVITRGVLAGSGDTSGLGGGGVQSLPVSASPSGRVYAAARVTPITSMSGPVRLEIVSETEGTVLAVDERYLTAGQETVLSASYTVGSAMDPNTWGDMEAMGTYGDIEGSTWGDLETDPIGGPVFVRLIQAGVSRDQFLVERLSLFDAPIVWQFSVDDGASWYDAQDVRNNPEAVLTFPEPGKALRWRALLFHEDAEVSALTIRPWYGGLVGAIGRSAVDFVGPNRSVLDDYPDTVDDPMWQQSHSIIPSWWYQRDVANPFSGPPNQVAEGEEFVPPVDDPAPEGDAVEPPPTPPTGEEIEPPLAEDPDPLPDP